MTHPPHPIDSAFHQALQRHQQGDLDIAAEQYRALLASAPEHAPALHFLGVLRHQQGLHEEANALVAQSLQHAPQHADWHNTWGNMLSAQGRGDEAVAAFLAALERDAHHVHAWNNLGATLLSQGLLDEALAALRNAVALDPTFRAAHQNLGDTYQRQGDTHAAALSYCAEYVLRPPEETRRDVLGIAYSQLGRHAEAAEVYARWLADEPGHPIATYLLAANQGQAPDERASAAYLQSYFDAYADSFEHKLVDGLQYSVPPQVRHLLAARETPARSLRILDAGCGTGLCGLQLSPFARELAGVDLSAKSLAIAETKGVYSALHQQDITAYLGACAPSRWDLLVAADMLIYFGDLALFTTAAHAVLAPGGYLLASFETLECTMDTDTPDYVLQPSGRYRHREDYLRRTLHAAGFQLETSVALDIRTELGRPVPGVLLLARKPEPA